VPTLDDEFSKKLGAESLPALKESLKKQIEGGKNQDNKAKAIRTAIDDQSLVAKKTEAGE
jgi:FKBP-type peptidyl-prolyl cis-trans isomerase (trigger factor)